MRLTIYRRQHDATEDSYNTRTYVTDNDDIILDFLNEYDGEGNLRQWIEDNVNDMDVLNNNMTLGYNTDECNIIDYHIVFDNDTTKTSIKC